MIPQLVRTGWSQDSNLESDTRIHTLNTPASTREGEAILSKGRGDCVSNYDVWFSTLTTQSYHPGASESS